jgi:hypothetical protein
MNHEITIEPFEPKYGERVVSLILPIQQREFGIPVTLRDQPDLLDIPNFYQNGVGNFWVAVGDDKVVGSLSWHDSSIFSRASLLREARIFGNIEDHVACGISGDVGR